MGINRLCSDAPLDNNPIQHFKEFMKEQARYKEAGEYDKWRFVGYALELDYSSATIITSDPYKIAVGGIPRNSLLIMVPRNYTELPLHFTLLRVLESAPTPLSREVQQTYFDLQKRSMPELDVFTQSELQWGALKTEVLGMFYPNPENIEKIEFSSDINNFVSAHKYDLYAPSDDVLNVIINSMVPSENCFPIGKLRLTECRLPVPGKPSPEVEAQISTLDFMGTRTAMFGKTRLGKSNTIKIIAQSLIETTRDSKNVGQIIFDINGEYANDNPQDGSTSLKSVYKDRCEVYSFSPRSGSGAKILKINFYEHPDRSHQILDNLLENDNKNSNYIKGFRSTEIPSIESIAGLTDRGDKIRTQRRILLYWAILKEAGFGADEEALKKNLQKINKNASSSLDPAYRKNLREAVYEPNIPPSINSLDELVTEFKKIGDYIKNTSGDDPLLHSSGSGDPLFDSEDRALLNFLKPNVGAGPRIIYPYRIYHDANAGNIFKEIINEIDSGKTVILDLGNADPRIMTYYSEELSWEVFRHQTVKFTTNRLKNHYVQLYFEEAHNLFPQNDDVTTIYSRLAKEGAKYHIGMVYSTQSPSTINKDLLAQTENFFIAHMSSRDEVRTLAKLNVTYENIQEDILQAKTPGYVRMLTRSHRFVVPVQVRKFSPITLLEA
jgi:DNA helicase HerA-like ATPase